MISGWMGLRRLEVALENQCLSTGGKAVGEQHRECIKIILAI